MQVAFGASVWPEQVSALRMKLLKLAPLRVTVEIGRLLLVVLVIVTLWTGDGRPAITGFANVTLAGVKPTDDGVPVPERLTVWVGLFGSLSCTVTVSERAPVAVGTNAAVIVHWAFGCRTAPWQPVSDTAKSPVLAPLKLMVP